MNLITNESLRRPEVLRWHRRIKERYTPPKGIRLTVVLPCSARKPYSKSKSHMLFQKYIRMGAKEKLALVHEVMLTSPLGLVPRELESVYPAAHYNVPVTGYWSREEKDIAVELLADYMKKAGTKLLGHVDGAYREICGELGIPLTRERILSRDSLQELEQKVSEALEEFVPQKRDKLELLRKICDFQFGIGAGEHLIPDTATVRGSQIFLGSEQVAAVNPNNGFFVLSLLGGKLLKEYGKYLVRISFKPTTNSIFCAGIDKADKEIRPGDEAIVIYEGEVVGVGKAVLNGEEMTRAKRGLGVSLRHLRKQDRELP
ncbi:MAG: DUF5591 domain-containing protein [Euryarchaeota archaeon]|nr:DUF5591 domain-containing protein [Euryarchaeota archaeon]